MAKKRQTDFAKTQLKPGRTAKRRTETNIDFKSKKIALPHRKHRDKNSVVKSIPDCLSALKSRPKDFGELKSAIFNSLDTLPHHLNDIFDFVFKMILDGDDSQRIAAVEIIIIILNNTTDMQIHGFMPRFIRVLSCAMVHAGIRIKELSLKLLNSVLQTHPRLICHSMSILDNLLQMLIGAPRKWTHSQSTSRSKSPMNVIYSDCVYSPDWRIHVLGHMNLFLKELLREKTIDKDQDRDEQEVYWDCKEPLFLEIYAEGGLKPVDIEKFFPTSFDCDEIYFDNSGSIEQFIAAILNIIPDIFLEEMASESKGDDDLLSKGTIANLSILFQVLNGISEWIKLLFYEEVESTIKKFLQEKVFDKKRFPFCQRGSLVGEDLEELNCVLLNLAVCNLFCTFLLESGRDNDDLNYYIFSYVRKIFKMRFEVKYNAIPMIVKLMKVYFGMREKNEVLEFLRECLSELCVLLGKAHEDSPNIQLLSSLFVKLSLDSAYHFLAESDAMKSWFKWLLNQLGQIPKSKKTMNKNMLNVIKKIANRKYPCFLEFLQKIDVKALLKYEDDNVRDTAIFLIYNMKDITPQILETVARLILLDSTFPKKFAVRLIRLLTCRFLEKPEKNVKIPEASIYNGKGLIRITHFILNIAVDSFSINEEKWTNYEANEYTKALKICKDTAPYILFPSLHWKEHSVLFEVCINFLNQLRQDVVKEIATNMFNEILENTTVLPMHSAIAILRLIKGEMSEEYYGIQITDLIFSALLTTSILTHISMDDEWFRWNVVELMNSIESMELSSETALKTLHSFQYLKDDNQMEGIVAFYILRICKFLLEKEILKQEDFPSVLETLDILQEKSSDKTLSRQPLFISLCKHCYYM